MVIYDFSGKEIVIYGITCYPSKESLSKLSFFLKRKTQTFASPLGEGVPPKNPPNLAKNMISYDKLRAIPKPQKTLGNPHFMGNPRVLTTFSLMRLLSHLSCYFSRKVLFLLLQALASLETDKPFHCQRYAFALGNGLHILFHIFLILCLHI